jgi:hypothetical protein
MDRAEPNLWHPVAWAKLPQVCPERPPYSAGTSSTSAAADRQVSSRPSGKRGGDLTVPAAACNSWRALYAGLAKLAEDLTEHVHIENNILFPKFEA